MTRIAVNTRLLKAGKLEGIGWFAWQSLRRIVEAHPEVQFHFLFDAPPSPEFLIHDNVTPHVVLPPARRIFLYKLWFDYLLPSRLRSIRPELFLSPDGFASLRTDVPQLPVIHDLNFEHHPEHLPPGVAHFYRSRFPRFAQLAARIATVSEYSKADIVQCYGIHPDRIDVVYNGVNPEFKQAAPEEVTQARARYTNGLPYVVYVGSIHPRKNVDGLIKAYSAFRERCPDRIQLVIVGAPMFNDHSVDAALNTSNYRDDIVFAGRLQPADLAQVVAGALFMAFIPHFEGFGIPILEAFASGVPLVAANRSSLPEVCGDAAYLVDARDELQVVDAFLRLAADEELRSRHIALGLKRATDFSWDKTADLLWKSIVRTLGDER
jgi:glycosyltransferase involved in cell wall biosynthesis